MIAVLPCYYLNRSYISMVTNYTLMKQPQTFQFNRNAQANRCDTNLSNVRWSIYFTKIIDIAK
jgi:hypothetical protein